MIDTLLAYDKALRNWLLPFFAKMDMKKITPATVKEWLIWTHGKWSQKTAKNAYGVLNIIMNGAVEDNTIISNPCCNISFKKQKKKNRNLLTVEELNLIFKTEWKRNVSRDVILLCCITGMRIGEAIAMRKENVYENYIDVKLSIPQYGKISDTKTHNPRYVPYPQGFDFALHEFCGWCFCHNGKRIKYQEVYDDFAKTLDAIGIDRKSRGITIHSLRNFFISYMQSKNVTESKIRATVGHADTTMTDLYTYWKPDMMPEVYAAQKKLYELIFR